MSPLDTWLSPLRAALPEIEPAGWRQLADLDTWLDQLTADAPAPDTGQTARSAWLLHVRRTLAEAGYTRPGQPAVAQTLAQFVCGFHDLDLRDATGLGHGALLRLAPEPTRTRWLTRLAAGQLVGIAATERHGGSRIQEITTRAVPVGPRRWAITGEKVWVSRLAEASGIVVFFRDPDAHLSAAIIDAGGPGVHREAIPPAGLAGWTWGELHLHEVIIDPRTDLIGQPGHGLDVFREHFARFRPLVGATALGTAAGVHTLVASTLHAKRRAGVLPRIRDNALITLGRTHAAVSAAFLATVHTARLCDATHGEADLWARIGKAHAVDTAHHAVHDLAALVGATGYQRASAIAKARADLTGLLYADGIHDSLYRSGGRTLLTHTTTPAMGAVLPLPVSGTDPTDVPAAA
jgi:alkylation response protein AidB-like acyl-CoA dehydrogenase